jgi:hypothetical protein
MQMIFRQQKGGSPEGTTFFGFNHYLAALIATK